MPVAILTTQKLNHTRQKPTPRSTEKCLIFSLDRHTRFIHKAAGPSPSNTGVLMCSVTTQRGCSKCNTITAREVELHGIKTRPGRHDRHDTGFLPEINDRPDYSDSTSSIVDGDKLSRLCREPCRGSCLYLHMRWTVGVPCLYLHVTRLTLV
jgi:hypothetical protein